MVKYIHKSGVRLSKQIKGLLDYGKIGHKESLAKVNCDMLVKGIIRDVRVSISKRRGAVEVGKLPVITCYESELRLLFHNLITNGLKFQLAGRKPFLKISCKSEKGYWKFCVQDNGIGIDEEYHRKIFMLFQRGHFTGKFNGTGIGLAHCKKIVELHYGTIWVESEVKKGSTFYFTINKQLSKFPKRSLTSVAGSE